MHSRSALLSLTLVSSFAFAQQAQTQSANPPRFVLKGDAPAGSLIRRDVAWSNRIPFDRKYSELTPDEKAVLHSAYENIGPGDEPPYPEDGLKPVVAAISKAQDRLMARGDLRLVVTVGPDGQATLVQAYDSPSPEMTRFVAQLFMLVRYKPALCGGVPCTMQYPFYLKFSASY